MGDLPGSVGRRGGVGGLIGGAGTQWTLGGIAVVLGIVSAWMFWNKDMPKTTNFLAWVVGIAIALGAIGGWAAGLIRSGLDLADAAGSGVIGVGAGFVAIGIGLVLNLEQVIKGWLFKRAAPKRFHYPLGYVAPTVAIGAGVPVFSVIFDWARDLINQVGGSIG